MRYGLLICHDDKLQAEMTEDEAGAQKAGKGVPVEGIKVLVVGSN